MKKYILICYVLLAISVNSASGGRNFNGSNQDLTLSAALFSAYPFTVCGWFRPANTTAAMTVFGVGDPTVAGNHWYIGPRGDQAGDPFWFTTVIGSGFTAATGNAFTANSWQHFCAMGISATSRRVILSGDTANAGTNTANVTPTGMTTTQIGQRANNETIYFSGDLAAFCIWSASLSDNEVVALANGIPCPKVRRAALFSCPIMTGVSSPEVDYCGPRSWSLTNSPAASSTNPGMLPFFLR
jgi:hypothetical protein